ncbi:Peptidase family U32 [compost metagenome]
MKDNCQFICGEDSDGLVVETLDRQPFLALNGVQTLSYTCQSLLQELVELAAAGISRIRLSPQDCDMVTVARIYEDVATGRSSATEGLERLALAYPHVPLSNGFHHGRSGATWIASPAGATERGKQWQMG